MAQVVRALACHQCGMGSIPARCLCQMWVEFVVGSRLASRVFLRVLRGFPSTTKTSTQNSNSIIKPACADVASSLNIISRDLFEALAYRRISFIIHSLHSLVSSPSLRRLSGFFPSHCVEIFLTEWLLFNWFYSIQCHILSNSHDTTRSSNNLGGGG